MELLLLEFLPYLSHFKNFSVCVYQVCPMSKSPYVDPHKSGHEIWEEFSMSFTPAVKEVVEFAKRIPGFRDLSQHDQVSLLKAGTFEVGFLYLNVDAQAIQCFIFIVSLRKCRLGIPNLKILSPNSTTV